MRLQVAAFVLALMSPLAIADDEQTLEQALRKLATLEQVGGSAIGYAGTPGAFFKVSRVVQAKGDATLFEKLAADERPVTRAMGLYCLAQTDTQRAARVLRRRLEDRGRVSYAPGGCVIWTISVGTFCRNLLWDNGCIDTPGQALLSADERLALDVTILVRDECSDLHENVAKTLDNSPPPYDLPALKQMCPDLEAWQLVKAIGRMRVQPRWRGFLIACLSDDTLDANAKKAAASALTRDTDPRAFAALKAHGEDRFVRAARLSRRHAALMAKVNAEKTWRGMEKIKATVIEAFTIDHPLALADLERSFSLAIMGHADVRAAVADSLLRTAARTKEFQESWSTYSDLPLRLERLLESDRFVSNPDLLSPKERAGILDRLNR